MAKIVIVWNEHPTEVVAGFHARKVAKILKEKYGHEVQVKKLPVKESNYGITRDEKIIAREAVTRLKQLPNSIERYKSTEPAAFVFNFHNSGALIMGQARKRKLSQFRIGSGNLDDDGLGFGLNATEILLEHRPSIKNTFIIELPAFYRRIKGKAGKPKHLKDMHKYLDTDEGWFDLAVEHNISPGHQTEVTPLQHPKQQKYLHPAISEKIAAAINGRIIGLFK